MTYQPTDEDLKQLWAAADASARHKERWKVAARENAQLRQALQDTADSETEAELHTKVRTLQSQLKILLEAAEDYLKHNDGTQYWDGAEANLRATVKKAREGL